MAPRLSYENESLPNITFLEQTLEDLFTQIESYLVPYQEAVTLLVSIPGIQVETAAYIIGEIGVDMTRFPSSILST